MIKAERISKSFSKMQVLRNISLEIRTGDFVAVMGPSGSGKSTLMYSISGMDRIDEGSVLFEGVNISQMSEAELSVFRLTRMGFVFQNAHMLKNLSVFDNITLPGYVAKKEPADDIRRRALRLLQRMEIEGIKEHDIREVSGGQLQRASICRAMINNPDILFLDEPTGALNSAATEQVLAILDDLNRDGITIVTITHNPQVAARARKVIYVLDGQIAAIKEFQDGAEREKEMGEWLRSLQPS
jgi:putative ABC transport system ATP-binding protein